MQRFGGVYENRGIMCMYLLGLIGYLTITYHVGNTNLPGLLHSSMCFEMTSRRGGLGQRLMCSNVHAILSRLTQLPKHHQNR